VTIRTYLPSAQFAVLIGAVALSAGLVYAAQRFTQPPSYSAALTTDSGAAENSLWQEELLAIAGSSTPPGAGGDVNALITAAQTKNLTESVGRTLLLNLSAAQGQGMTNDEPTQNAILSAALNQVASTSAPAYTIGNLIVVTDSPETLRAYGNGVMAAVNAHPKASYPRVALAIGAAVDNSDASQGAVLLAAAADYRALAKELATLPVPASLQIQHVNMINNFAAEANACADMAAILPDPLRGLQGFQNYQAKITDNMAVFTSIGATLSNNGILFSKDEPGSAWATLRS